MLPVELGSLPKRWVANRFDNRNTTGGLQIGRPVLANTQVALELARPLRTKGAALFPPTINTVREALDLIARLDQPSRATLHWRLALNLLEYAQMAKTPEIIELATDAVENALASDNWLAN